MNSASFTPSRLVAAAVLILTVPLSLWLIPEAPEPKPTDAPLLPPAPVMVPVNPGVVVEKPSQEMVQAALDTYYAALNAHDAKAVMDLWANMEEVLVELPGSAPVTGRPAVEAAYKIMTGPGGVDQVMPNRVRMRVTGGRAEVALLETLNTVERGGVRKQHTHVATHVLMRTDSGWRFVAHRRLAERDLTIPDAGR